MTLFQQPVGEVAREVVDFLLPTSCLGCGSRISHDHPERIVCPHCTSRLRPLPWPRCPRCDHPVGTGRGPAGTCRECRHWPEALTYARSAVVLEPPANALVHAMKYEGWRELAPLMAAHLARVSLPVPTSTDDTVIVPVPTSRARERARGYNQAGILASAFSTLTGKTMSHVLLRASGQRSQVSLHPSERMANVRHAFGLDLRRGGAVRERHVVVVDDVLTTGSTVAAIATILKEAGAASVTALTFARALPFRV